MRTLKRLAINALALLVLLLIFGVFTAAGLYFTGLASTPNPVALLEKAASEWLFALAMGYLFLFFLAAIIVEGPRKILGELWDSMQSSTHI